MEYGEHLTSVSKRLLDCGNFYGVLPPESHMKKKCLLKQKENNRFNSTPLFDILLKQDYYFQKSIERREYNMNKVEDLKKIRLEEEALHTIYFQTKPFYIIV